MHPRCDQRERFVEQRAPAVHVGGMEDGRGDLGMVERVADRAQTAGAVADVEVKDARLPAHQSAHVRVGRDAQQLVLGRLAGAVIADRQLTHAEDEVDEHEVPAHVAGGGGRGHVVAAGEAPRAQPLDVEPARHRDQLRRCPDRVVGAEHADRGRHAAAGEPAERHRRHPGMRAGLAPAAGEVDVAVDEPRNHPPAGQVHLVGEPTRKRRLLGADPDDRLAGDEETRAAPGSGVVEVGVEEEGEHWRSVKSER